MEPWVFDFIQAFGLVPVALLMYITSVRHRERVEAEGRQTLNRIANSQSERADKLEDELRIRERELHQKQLEVLETTKMLQGSQILYEDSQKRLGITERLLHDERGKVDAMNMIVNGMKMQMTKLEKKVQQLETALDAEVAKRSDLEHKIRELESALDAAKAQETELKHQLGVLKEENAALRDKNVTLEREKTDLERRVLEIEARLNAGPIP